MTNSKRLAITALTFTAFSLYAGASANAAEEPFAFELGSFIEQTTPATSSAAAEDTSGSLVSPMSGPVPLQPAAETGSTTGLVFPQAGATPGAAPLSAQAGTGPVSTTSASAFLGNTLVVPDGNSLEGATSGGLTSGFSFEGGSFETAPPREKPVSRPETTKAPDTKPGDDGFGVNNFERAGETKKPPQETTKRQERQPPKRERVDADTRPGGGDDFGQGGDFQKPGETKRKPEQRRKVERTRPNQRQQRRSRPDQREQQRQRSQGPRVDPGITAFELRSFGIEPTQQLRQSRMHGPTPTRIPGGQVITTQYLANAMVNKEKFVLIDVLNSDYTIPRAWGFRAMASGGNFRDRAQQQVSQWLAKVTGRNASYPIVVFCSDPMCWMSYNAALRARAAGYRNIYWYRGGLRAWQMAGLKLVASGF